MTLSFHDTVHALCDPRPTRRQSALLELERRPDRDIKQFADRAIELQFSSALQICGVLSGTTSEHLVNLLGRYASRDEALLKNRALQALENVPGDVRTPCAIRLLEAVDAETRVTACRLLGDSGALAAREPLIEALHDGVQEVVLAAMHALERLQCTEALDELIELLDHADDEVRSTSIETIVRLAPADRFPAQQIVQVAIQDASSTPRVAACWALEQRPEPKIRRQLLDAFTGAKDAATRSASASALGRYHASDVTEELLLRAAQETIPSVALNCRRALSQHPPSLVIDVAREMLSHGDLRLRCEVASALGQQQEKDAFVLLVEQLELEEDDLVRAAIIEALGHSGLDEGWSIIRPHIGDDMIVAYAAVSALGELLTARHVHDYASILQEQDDATLQEAVLRTLSAYAFANGIPSSATEIVRSYINHPDLKVRMFALRILSFTHDMSEVTAIFQVFTKFEDDKTKETAAAAAVELANGSLQRLAESVEPNDLTVLKEIIDREAGPALDSVELVEHLSARLDKGQVGAGHCIEALLYRDPGCMAGSLDVVSQSVLPLLLNVYEKMPESMRSVSKLDFAWILSRDLHEVRKLALRVVPMPLDDVLLSRVTELAIGDEDESVREVARQRVRETVEA